MVNRVFGSPNYDYVLPNLSAQTNLFNPNNPLSVVNGTNVGRLHAVLEPGAMANNWVCKKNASLAEYEEVSQHILDTVYENYLGIFNHKKNTVNYNDVGLASRLSEDIYNYLYDIEKLDQGTLDIDDLSGPIADISENLFRDPCFLADSKIFIDLASSRNSVYLNDFMNALIDIYLNAFTPQDKIQTNYYLRPNLLFDQLSGEAGLN